jgi:hypothetical protein
MSESDLPEDLDGELAEDTNLTPEQYENRSPDPEPSDPAIDLHAFAPRDLIEQANSTPAEFGERHAAAEFEEREKNAKRQHRDNEVRELLGLHERPVSPELEEGAVSDAESESLLHQVAEEERAGDAADSPGQPDA